MKVSQVEIVYEITQKLVRLRLARNCVVHGALSVSATGGHHYMDKEVYDLGEMLTVAGCRSVLRERLNHEISCCIEHLKTYGVDDDRATGLD